MRISVLSSDVCSSVRSGSVFGEGRVNVVRTYLKKGAKVYIEGPQRTRKYEKDGVTHYATEVHVRGPGSTLTMLDGRSDSDNAGGGQRSQGGGDGNGRVHDSGRRHGGGGGGIGSASCGTRGWR